MSYIYRYNLDELYHHGVPGMRWGHRKHYATSSSKRRPSSKMEDSASYKYNKPGESGWVGLGRAIKAQRNSINTKLANKIQKRNLKKIEKHNAKIDRKVAKYEKEAERFKKGYLEDIKNLKTDSDTQYLYKKYGLDLNQEIEDMEEAMKDTRKYYEKKINDLLASKK